MEREVYRMKSIIDTGALVLEGGTGKEIERKRECVYVRVPRVRSPNVRAIVYVTRVRARVCARSH